ncbi:Uncharacterized protein SCG7086_BK_00100 [Chlamydiales bacterium SCGC AG-110-P3]|nr:Uncharacterized protein SCG7086_BK_00100 [Chlamydiales bacterium SCGC AG-110-P3]
MRVLFLIQDSNLPSSRIRVVNLLSHLEKHNVIPFLAPYPKKLSDRLRLFQKLPEFDAVYLQRKLITAPELFILRRRAHRLLFDFDDAIYQHDDSHPDPYSRTRQTRFQSIVRASDHVVVGNTILGDKLTPHDAGYSVIPSSVPVTNVPEREYSALNTRLRIGWVGTKGNFRYLETLRQPLLQLARDYPLELRVVSNAPFHCDGIDVINIEWSAEQQEKEIAQFDIGVMPLSDTSWTRGKCGYKALQYMASGVVPIVSDVGDNAAMVTHGCDGFKAANPATFYDAMASLAASPEQMRSMGICAREKVKIHYSQEVIAERLAKVIHSVVHSSQYNQLSTR